MQLDTKHILDKDALPAEVYAHIKHYHLPLYEWNIIDVATRIRFTAYSHELSSVFGMMFLSLVLLWLRAHNVRSQSASDWIMAQSSAEGVSASLTSGMSICPGSMPHCILYLQGQNICRLLWRTLIGLMMSVSLLFTQNAASQLLSSL